MIQLLNDGLDEITFRPFLLWYLSKCTLMLGLGATCLWLALHSARAWWGGVLLAVVLALLLVARYYAQAVIIRGNDLILRAGTLKARERIFPIWQVDLELDQSLLGRLFDYATIQQHSDTGVLAVHAIASARALRFIVAQRRMFMLRMLTEQRLMSSDRLWGARAASNRPSTPPRSLPSRRTS